MSRLLVALCAGLSAVAMTASACGTLARPVAKPKPAGSIRIVFQGSGQETVQDVQRHVTISENACTQRQTLNATVSLTWNVAWGRMRVSALHTAAGAPTHPTQVSASLGADRVRDGCDRPDQTPPDWFGSDRCDYPLVSVDTGSIFGARGRTGSVGIEVTAPRFALPPAAACPVNIRSDQYVAHVSVKRKTLAALRRGRSITIRVGTGRPGPGDVYQTILNCSQSPKPYDNYRLFDSCTDQVSWSGRVVLTKL